MFGDHLSTGRRDNNSAGPWNFREWGWRIARKRAMQRDAMVGRHYPSRRRL